MKLIVTGSASLVLLLSLAACGAPPNRDDGANQGAAPAAPANAVTPAPKAATAPATAPLLLEGAGLRIPGASPPRAIAFGTAEATAVQALSTALGGAPTGGGGNEECGEGPLEFVEWKDRIRAWFQDGRFAGWEAKGDLRTAAGVGIGSTRAEAAKLPGFDVEESTLGIEFTADGLSGILASNAPDARVTDLRAGATCVFR